MNNFDIFELNDNEISDVCSLIIEAFENSQRYSKERVFNEISPTESIFYKKFFVAKIDGKIVGVAGVKATDWASNTHVMYMSAVNKTYRNQGIGRALVEARVKWVINWFNTGRILVSTHKSKRYKSFGFKPIPNCKLDGRQLMVKVFSKRKLENM